MLAGASAEESARYRLPQPADPDGFAYTRGAPGVPGASDSERWRETHAKMELCGLAGEAQGALFELLAAVLHLGNLDSGDGEEARFDATRLQCVAELLQVDVAPFDGG